MNEKKKKYNYLKFTKFEIMKRKNTIIKIIKNSFLFLLGSIFVILTLIGLGAITEKHYLIITRIMRLLLSNSLFIIISYLAFNFTTIAIIKFTLINGCISSLFWEEILNPGKIKTLFSFTKADVYLHENKKTFKEILETIPAYNPKIPLEDKIRFCLNPISLLIALFIFTEESIIYLINSLPQKTGRDDRYNNNNNFQLENYYASNLLYKSIKGITSIMCNLAIIPLKFIAPIGNIFYKILFLFTVTIPDYVIFIAKPNNNKSKHKHIIHHHSISERFFKNYSTCDIRDKLQQ